VSAQAERTWTDTIRRLFDFPMRVIEVLEDCGRHTGERPHLVEMSQEAKSIWVQWWNRHVRETEDHELDGKSGAWSKMRVHAARFALILSRIRWACDPPPIGNHLEKGVPLPETICDPEHGPPGPVLPQDVKGAIMLAEYFKSHLLRVAHRMKGCLGDANAQWIVDWIRRKQLETFNSSDVSADCRRFRDNPMTLDSALKLLENVNAIRLKSMQVDPHRRGRKPSPTYEVNPELLRAPENTINTVNSLAGSDEGADFEFSDEFPDFEDDW
jgi:hypothetical protein